MWGVACSGLCRTVSALSQAHRDPSTLVTRSLLAPGLAAQLSTQGWPLTGPTPGAWYTAGHPQVWLASTLPTQGPWHVRSPGISPQICERVVESAPSHWAAGGLSRLNSLTTENSPALSAQSSLASGTGEDRRASRRMEPASEDKPTPSSPMWTPPQMLPEPGKRSRKGGGWVTGSGWRGEGLLGCLQASFCGLGRGIASEGSFQSVLCSKAPPDVN